MRVVADRERSGVVPDGGRRLQKWSGRRLPKDGGTVRAGGMDGRERLMVVGERCRGEHGAETTAARGCCKGSAEQADGLEGEQARLADLCAQRDSGGEYEKMGERRQ